MLLACSSPMGADNFEKLATLTSRLYTLDHLQMHCTKYVCVPVGVHVCVGGGGAQKGASGLAVNVKGFKCTLP